VNSWLGIGESFVVLEASVYLKCEMMDDSGCPRISTASYFLCDQKVTKESSTPTVSSFP
jgi:hypothetical protein